MSLNGIISTNNNNNNNSHIEHGHWSTELFDCLKDEETCWWGTWCCWMLNSRTIASFELNKSLHEIGIFWVIMISIIISLILPNILSLFVIILGILYLTYRRALFRTKIREKLLIPGNFSDDFSRHLCCSCCAICQEAREANESSLLVLDYCSGETIEMQEIAHDIATGRINSTLQNPTTDEGGTFWNHLINISMTSKIILFLCSIVTIISFIVLFLLKREKNIIVLLLTFVQPILILYFVYWRSRRQYASLDMVIKLFAVGFWLTTFQSVILEEILQGLLFVILGPFLATSINDDDQYGDDNYKSNTATTTSLLSSSSPSSSSSFSSSSTFLNTHFYKITKLVSFFQKVNLLQTNYNPYESISDPSNSHLNDNPDNENENNDNSHDAEDGVRSKMQNHLVIIIIVVFFMAFVMAACVEETMKHFSVRCCRFPSPLRDPHTILVYLMASALGFATSENIEYVFGATSSVIPGTSVFVSELIVLFVRVLMPIHLICSVIQAANLSNVLLGQKRMSLFMILLPAIILHGVFDFSLMLIGALQYIYKVEGILLEIISFGIALVITIIGAIYAYISFERVQDNFLSGWQSFQDEETGSTNENDRL